MAIVIRIFRAGDGEHWQGVQPLATFHPETEITLSRDANQGRTMNYLIFKGFVTLSGMPPGHGCCSTHICHLARTRQCHHHLRRSFARSPTMWVAAHPCFRNISVPYAD
jgi:hypothetical protein